MTDSSRPSSSVLSWRRACSHFSRGKRRRLVNRFLCTAPTIVAGALGALFWLFPSTPLPQLHGKPDSTAPDHGLSTLTAPPGFTVELVAGPPLVERPMMAGFDERGRLYVCDSSGFNLMQGTSEVMVQNPTN